MDFSIVIPTYNGAQRLPPLLDKLRSQTGTENIAWEIIVVDNNSSDDTGQVVREIQENWLQNFHLKYCLEIRQGAAFARHRGLEEAEGELVGFLDDDNWPASDWVMEAYTFSKAHPRAAVYGGQIHGSYEVPPPEHFEKIQGFLAIRERGSQPNQYKPEVLSLPPGAAMVVRKIVWQAAVPKSPKMTGKLPSGAMVQGDDWEPLMYIHKAGWEIWYNPTMHTYHQIPAWRLERKYLLRLIHGSCLSFCPLKMIAAQPWEKPVILTRTVLGNSYNALRHYLKHYRQLESNLIAECEMQIYLSRIQSSFYFLKTILKQ